MGGQKRAEAKQEQDLENGGKRIISWEEIKKHDKPNDCWVVYEGTVYDVTEFVPNHPGGAAIWWQGGGRDITILYNISHPPRITLEDIPNIQVMMVLRSLASRNYLSEIYSWQWHYYTLTNEGIEYLREVLHLPAQVFPSTLTKQRPTRPALAGADQAGGDGGKGKGWGKGQGEA